MRFRLQVAAACLAAVACSATAAQPHLQTAKEKFSYAIGLSLGNQLRQGGITDIDPASLALAVQDLLAGVPPRLTMDEMKQAQADYRKALVDEQRQVAARNLKSGNDFLAANGKKDGVITLDSGVQYKVIKAGEGSSPNIDDSVVAHYRGTRLDGRQFDSSYDRGEPLTFALKGVITGWQQVVTRL
ncbi:MAG: hypothetical protein HOI95_01370, partial [Chromatiales bacterium]|nr:hypothetical protein [Chromatiales bacterium]